MPTFDLAVQLYTLRDHAKTAEDLAATAKRLADMGWSAAQVSAVWLDDATVVRQILDDAKMKCVATHVRPADRPWTDPDGLATEMKTLGTDLTAVGGFFPGDGDFNQEKWLAWIQKFNEGVQNLKKHGLKLGYHNHSHEWGKLGGKDDFESETAMDLLVDKLDPEAWFEIDTYWVAHAGGCPAAWLRKLKGRVPLIHIKDLAVSPGREQYMAEIGVGNLDWPGILEAAGEAGVQTLCVEQDTCYRDPFDSLETSLKNLKAMGL